MIGSTVSTLKDKINNALNNLLAEIYEEHNITVGDISPEQLLKWETIVDDITELFTALVKQNFMVNRIKRPKAICDNCRNKNKGKYKTPKFSMVCGKENYYTCVICEKKGDDMWIIESKE